jgi:hypothetical protein
MSGELGFEGRQPNTHSREPRYGNRRRIASSLSPKTRMNRKPRKHTSSTKLMSSIEDVARPDHMPNVGPVGPLKEYGIDPVPGRKRQAARQTFLQAHRAFCRGEFRAYESRPVNPFSGRTVPASRL